MEGKELQKLEEFITQFPLYEYQIIATDTLTFTPRVRTICAQECQRFGTTWACPPGVGDLEECRLRCLSYDEGFFFSSVSEVSDIMNMEELLNTRKAHEDITNGILEYLKELGYECFTLSTESCAICEECTYPQQPCRFPEIMHPCLESHGVVVSEIVENQGMTYSLGGNTVLWFSLILFDEKLPTHKTKKNA